MAIVLKTISDSSQAQADLAKLRDSVNGIQSSVDKVSNSFSNFLRLASVGIAGYATFQTFAKYSDELTNLETKLRVATQSQLEFTFALDQVRRIANTTRSDLQSVASLYSRLSRAGKDFGAAQGDIAKATELISKAMAVSGSGAQEANAAIIQLGQALASGRLAGDELRSILENAPPLAEAIAKGLGVSIGKLRQLGEEGKLSSVNVFKAILKQQDEIEKNFAKVTVTYGAAFQNLGNSLVILFDEVKKAALGSTSGFAESINNLANSIFSFATNLGFTLAVAKLKLVLFVTDSVLLFNDLWDSLKETGVRIEETTRTLYDKWRPTLVRLTEDVVSWAKYVAVASTAAATSLYAAFQATNIGQIIINNTKAFISTIRQFITSAFSTISANIPKIDIRSIFPGLDLAIQYVRGWAIAVERWFFWLYDKVIGNSWIPDLVQKTTEWVSKLNKKPLSIIAEFVEKANLRFGGINITAPFITGVAALYKFRGILLSVLGVFTAIAAVVAGFKFFKDGTLEISQEPEVKKTNKLEDLTRKSVEGLQKVRKQIEESFNNSLLGRSLKQLFGLKDTTPGQVFGVQIDTEAQVGRGPYRSSMDRPFGHDFINMLPPGWQVPLIAAFTGVFALAIIKAFDGGPVRSVLLSVVTTLGAIFASRVVDDKTISSSFGKAAFTFISIVEKGITSLFSGSVLNDPLGVLSTVAKTALLFQAGREAIAKAALGIATAPTKAAQAVTSTLERNLLRRDIDKTNKEIAKLPNNLKAAVTSNRTAFDQTVNQLAQLRDSNGALIGQQRALAAINARNVSAFGTLESRIRTGEGIRGQDALTASQANLNNVREIRRNLVASREESSRRERLITENLQKQADSLREGIRNVGAGAGGILGGLAGLQIGTEIARGMTSSPEWVRVGTALGISFAGQAVGAGIGSIIAQTFVSGVSGVGSLIGRAVLFALTPIAAIIASPFLLAAAGIVALITAALNWDSLKSIFNNFSEFWKAKISPILDGLVSRLEVLWQDIKRGITNRLDLNRPVADLPVVGEVTRKDVTDIAATTGIIAAIAAKLGAFDKLVGSFRAGLASNLAGISMQVDLFRQTVLSNLGNLRASLGPLATLGAVIMGAITAVLSVGAVKVAIVAGVSYLVYKLVTELTGFLVDETKAQKPSLPSSPAVSAIPRAMGGWISGPGTSTSDSIPALLSNGEFVVNAKDARKNWDILTAINSGMGVRRYAEGTATTSTGATEIAVQIFERLKSLLGFNKPAAPSTTLPSGQELKGTLQSLLESSNNLDKAFVETKKSLENAGFESVDLKAIKNLAERDPAQFRKFASAIDEANKAILNSTDKRLSQFLRNENLQRANDVFRSIADNLAKAGIAQVPSKFVEQPEEKKPTKLTFGDELKLIQEAFPELTITLEELSNMSDTVRERLLRDAASIAQKINAINSLEIGTLEGGLASKLPGGEINKRRQAIETERKSSLTQARDAVKAFRVPFKDLKVDFDKIGINISEEAFNSLDEITLGLIEGLRSKAVEQFDVIKKVDVTSDVRRRAQESFGEITKDINKILQEAPTRGLRNLEGFKTRIASLGIQIDENIFNALTNAERDRVEQSAIQVNALRTQIKEFEKDPSKDPSGAFRNILQKIIDDILTDSTNFINTKGKDYKSRATLAGESLASSVSESLSSGLSNVLKGKATPKEFLRGVLDTFTSGVIDTFVKGLLDPFTNQEKGPLNTLLKGLGTGIFKSGEQTAENASQLVKETPTEFSFGGIFETFSKSFKGFFDSFKGLFTNLDFGSLFSGISSLFKTGFSSVFSLFGFAEGGKVSGPGTGTSDSVPAMLSNGEFVVNAQATRKNLALLTAINGNRFRKFMEGGLVSTAMIASPAMANIGPATIAQNKGQQVFNINITGDISRQTKAEIYQMLPSIAEGVNSHNRERGYKG
jgi:tape measure domain-containing protein